MDIEDDGFKTKVLEYDELPVSNEIIVDIFRKSFTYSEISETVNRLVNYLKENGYEMYQMIFRSKGASVHAGRAAGAIYVYKFNDPTSYGSNGKGFKPEQYDEILSKHVAPIDIGIKLSFTK